MPAKLEQPTPEHGTDLYLDGGNAFISGSDHLGVLSKFVIHHANQLIVKFQHHIHQLTSIHFECLLGVAVNAFPQCQCLLGNRFVHDLHMIHSVHTVVGGTIVLCAVYHEVVIIIIEHQCDGFHNIVVMLAPVNLFAVFIQIVVVEDDLFLLLDGIF